MTRKYRRLRTIFQAPSIGLGQWKPRLKLVKREERSGQPRRDSRRKRDRLRLEPRVRQLPGSGWAECYDGKDGHQCNAIHVSEGIDEEGQLYVRREWASSKFGLVEMQVPDDFTPQGWGPAYVPESSDTLEEVLAHLDSWLRTAFSLRKNALAAKRSISTYSR